MVETSHCWRGSIASYRSDINISDQEMQVQYPTLCYDRWGNINRCLVLGYLNLIITWRKKRLNIEAYQALLRREMLVEPWH